MAVDLDNPEVAGLGEKENPVFLLFAGSITVFCSLFFVLLGCSDSFFISLVAYNRWKSIYYFLFILRS